MTAAERPMLQGLMNYPVITSGIGTMPATLLVGRLLSSRVDVRPILAAGLGVAAFSLYQMTNYSLAMDYWPIIWAGIVQGVGLGFLFVPLSAVAFATLSPLLRTEAAGVFSLARNIGGSIGISIVETVLARSTQINHSSLAARSRPSMQGSVSPGPSISGTCIR